MTRVIIKILCKPSNVFFYVTKFKKKKISWTKIIQKSNYYRLIFRISRFEFERIRGKKLDFHRLFRLIGFLRRPTKWRGFFSMFCTRYVSHSRRGGLDRSLRNSLSAFKITIQYNCKWEIILDSCLNCFVDFELIRSNQWLIIRCRSREL